ncbi:N-acetyltransferase GCN5 [Liquorilactobacillus ghanensis DSM 18630]|uniref:N-acetyltransferase GCN5 n=1 Tax=Liquorilactobacillus ghanensis DSM 18630 TaxID=1423750 RepID=A0A0R1VJ55_9LACO|nr:GNAT family N-acetyltransferase [Liquorilactobacillus ghanensis]KRM05221.1 N-acetyltransferase GCN5 [Liquorilactobacillus ghanensis DSM 18630]
MKILIDSVNEWNLKTVMQIEQSSFSTQEAAAPTAMKERQQQLGDTFLGAFAANRLVGFIVGPAISNRYLNDDLFQHVVPNPTATVAPFQAVLSLAVASPYRGQKIGSQLLSALAERATIAGRQGITLTCLPSLISFYQKNGFHDEGIAASQHAGEVWHNLFLPLTD